MAYPYQITTAAKLLSPMYDPGPHVLTGDRRFVVLNDKPNNHVEVWESSDTPAVEPGDSWSEADSANHKSSATNQNIDTHRSGDSLYISYSISGTNAVNIAEFNLSTRLWGAVVTGGPVVTSIRKAFRMSNGNVRLLFNDLDGSSRLRLNVQTWNGTTWSATTIVFEPGVVDTSGGYQLISAHLDTTDNLHILVSQGAGGNFRYRTYTSADALTTVIKIGTMAHNFIGATNGNAIAFTSADADLIAFPVPLTALIGSLDLASATAIICANADSPSSFAAHAIADDLVTDDGTNFENYSPSLVYLDGSLYFYYSKMTSTPEFHVRRTCSKLGGWAAPTTLIGPISGSTNHIRYVAARAVAAAKIGFAFSHDWTNTGGSYEFPWYYEDTPTCAADSACAAGATPIYRVN